MENKETKYIIRPVKPEDAEEFIKLKNFVWRSAYKDIFPEEVFIGQESEQKVNTMIAGFAEHICNDNEHFAYVAVVNNRIIGLATGRIKTFYLYFGEDVADFVALYIHPDYQGKGIANKFKKLFENWIKENGVNKYVINVLKDNNKARKVYEVWGGTLSEHEEKFTQLGIDYDEVFYTYEL